MTIKNDPESMMVFCAALQGFIASDAFRVSPYRLDPDAAVNFARSVVRSSWNNNPKGSGVKIT